MLQITISEGYFVAKYKKFLGGIAYCFRVFHIYAQSCLYIIFLNVTSQPRDSAAKQPELEKRT